MPPAAEPAHAAEAVPAVPEKMPAAPETAAQEMPKAAAAPAQMPATAAENATPAPAAQEAAAPPAESAPKAAVASEDIRTKEKLAPVDARRDSDGLRVTFSFADCNARRRCSAAPIRCGWCSIPTKPIDVEPIRDKGGRHHRRGQPAAAGEGPGDPHPPQPAADALAGGRGAARSATNWTLTFADRGAGAATAADGGAQHHRSRARQCQRAARQSRPAAPAGRSRRRRHALWWSPRRRRSAASSSGRISSNCRCWNPSTASRCVRTPTTSPSRSAPTRSCSAGPAA